MTGVQTCALPISDLFDQARRLRPRIVCLNEETDACRPDRLPEGTRVLFGEKGMTEAACSGETDIVLAAAAVVCLPASRLAAFQEATKTIYFTAVDAKSGKPITDLKAEELAAAEDGQFRPATSLKKADTPVSVLMLADTTKEAGGTGLDRRSTSGSAAGELIRDIRAAFSEFNVGIVQRVQ